MPLREIKDINARLVNHLPSFHESLLVGSCSCSRLDAIEDLMRNPSYEEQFVKVAKGLPDLERIVSRIHAKNCKVKDFLKVLSVSFFYSLVN